MFNEHFVLMSVYSIQFYFRFLLNKKCANKVQKTNACIANMFSFWHQSIKSIKIAHSISIMLKIVLRERIKSFYWNQLKIVSISIQLKSNCAYSHTNQFGLLAPVPHIQFCQSSVEHLHEIDANFRSRNILRYVF